VSPLDGVCPPLDGVCSQELLRVIKHKICFSISLPSQTKKPRLSFDISSSGIPTDSGSVVLEPLTTRSFLSHINKHSKQLSPFACCDTRPPSTQLPCNSYQMQFPLLWCYYVLLLVNIEALEEPATSTLLLSSR
jgi:hypothetical protein